MVRRKNAWLGIALACLWTMGTVSASSGAEPAGGSSSIGVATPKTAPVSVYPVGRPLAALDLDNRRSLG